MDESSRLFRPVLMVLVAAMLIVSGLRPLERGTWLLEVFPVIAGLVVAAATFRRFPFTPLVCVVLTIHAAILMLGGHYTYAKVPLGDWVRDALRLSRNPYDRLGHFAQGFTPALVTRELFIRRGVLQRTGWMFFLVLCVCLAISAAYELIEWATALLWGNGASAFLGTQGDEWDTQWDMFSALIGCIVAQVGCARFHDRQIARLSIPRGR